MTTGRINQVTTFARGTTRADPLAETHTLGLQPNEEESQCKRLLLLDNGIRELHEPVLPGYKLRSIEFQPVTHPKAPRTR